MIAPILEPFIDEVRKVNLKPPKIPYVSNVTGTWITAADATSPNYWARHVHQMVRFAEGLDELSKVPDRVLLEVGPGRTLSSAARRQRNQDSGYVVLSSLPHAYEQDSETAFLLNSLGQLWLAGADINWSAFSTAERRRRVSLPTYPFERQRYWIEPQQPQFDVPGPIGHMDHRVMAAREIEQPELANLFVAPRTPLESVIAQVWQEVLGLKRVSMDDDFFKLGGHSLLASQVIARLRKALQLELPLHNLFETTTIADQAAHIETVRWLAQNLQTPVADATADDQEEDFL